MRAGELVTDGGRLRRMHLGRTIGPPIIAIGLGVSGLTIAAYLVSGRSLIPLGVPVALLGTLVAVRQPVVAVASIFVLTGFQGTVTASTQIPVTQAVNLLVAALWLGVIAGYASNRRERQTWLWPGLIGVGGYVLLTFASLLTTGISADAFESFRTSAWFMAGALLIALAPWSQRTYLLIARAIALVALAVGLYAVFRYIVGPSDAEEILAGGNARRLGIPGSTELRFFGSFIIAADLAGWTASLVPFTFALALGDRGRWRAVAVVATATCAFAMLVSEVRTGLVAGVAGATAVAVLFSFARAFPSGRRLAATLGAVLVTVIGGGLAYSATVGGSEDASARYERLVTAPSTDYAYAARLTRWSATLDIVEKEPFGYGLGTQGAVGRARDTGLVGPSYLDSSYLKVGVEQGLLVMILLIGALVLLLVSLGAFATRTPNRQAAMLAIAGAGALASGLVLFYSVMFIEGLVVIPLWIAVGIGAAQPSTRPSREGARAE